MNPLRIFILLLLITTISSTTNKLSACDICGCAGGMAYGSILPQFQTNVGGIRYQHARFRHSTTNPNMNGESKVLNDQLHHAEVWMRYKVRERWFINAFLPYKINLRSETIYNSRISGLGDARLELSHIFHNSGDSMNVVKKHTLMGTAGIKLNNGKYMQRLENKVMAPSAMQTGSGAFAGWLRLQHIFRVRRAGLMTDAQFWTAGTNEMGYRQGNQTTARISAFYWLKTAKSQWLIFAGPGFEHFAKDKEFEISKATTGGQFLSGNAGLEWYGKRLSVQCSYQTNIQSTVPQQQPLSKGRLTAGMALFF